MWRFLVTLILIVSEAASQYHNIYQPVSAASEAQIKFAIENKYDDTGPGAKGREYAYNTYKTLDEALIGYLNDPDTKLPENERARALNIISSYGPQNSFNTQYPSNHFQNKPYNSFAFPQNRIYRPENRKPSMIFNYDAIPVSTPPAENHLDSFKHQRVQNVKGSPITVGHYTKPKLPQNDYHKFDSLPQYTNQHGYRSQAGPNNYPVGSQHSGAVENVGYYTFVDANGKAQTVHYLDDGRRNRRGSYSHN